MLSWRRMATIVLLLTAAKGIVAILAADGPPLLLEPPAQRTEIGGQKSEVEGQRSEAPSSPVELADAFTPSPEFQDWITGLVRQQLPDNYEKRKNWGHTAKSFDGLSIRLDDGQIKTHRKFEEKNDGKWQMYRVKLKDPAEKFDIKITNIRKLDGGKVGLEIMVDADLEVFGRQSLWQHGVQLYSLSAEADARVRLWSRAEVATHVNLTRFPPDVSLDPTIVEAKFEIPDFRMRRIGELKGPLVRSLSHSIREALEEKLADDNQKIVEKLNRAIDKQEKKLKLSLADVMQSKWKGLLGNAATTPTSK